MYRLESFLVPLHILHSNFYWGLGNFIRCNLVVLVATGVKVEEIIQLVQ